MCFEPQLDNFLRVNNKLVFVVSPYFRPKQHSDSRKTIQPEIEDIKKSINTAKAVDHFPMSYFLLYFACLAVMVAVGKLGSITNSQRIKIGMVVNQKSK
jgi:hypothetical protein